jgi:hypothetical protein
MGVDEDYSIALHCPKCKSDASRPFGALLANKTVTCTACGAESEVDGLLDAQKAADKSMADFRASSMGPPPGLP